MRNRSHIFFESVIVFFLTLITMPIQVGHLIHHHMNMNIAGVCMDSVCNLVFRRVVLYDGLSILICLFRCHIFTFIKRQYRMSYTFSFIFPKFDCCFLHFFCCCLGRRNASTSYISGFFGIKNIVCCIVICVFVEKLLVLAYANYSIICHCLFLLFYITIRIYDFTIYIYKFVIQYKCVRISELFWILLSTRGRKFPRGPLSTCSIKNKNNNQKWQREVCNKQASLLLVHFYNVVNIEVIINRRK